MSNLYIRDKHDELANYTCDQTVIIQKKYLPYLSNYKEAVQVSLASVVDWYPLTNSYYPYTEDVDAFARVDHLIGSKNVDNSFTVKACSERAYEKDPYSESGAQLQYLLSIPTSFLILGKPGIGQKELGKLLSENWDIIYIDPETLIEEELKSGSRAGSCIEFNLRCGRAIGVDVILKLLEKRVQSQSALHKGFVLAGFPLIQNDLYEEDPVSSETAVFNVQEIFEDIFDTVIELAALLDHDEDVAGRKASRLKFDLEEELEEEQEEKEIAKKHGVKIRTPDEETEGGGTEPASPRPPRVLPPDLGTPSGNVCVPASIGADYEKQLKFIFDLFDQPFIILYVACPNADVVAKHASYRYNVLTRETIDLQSRLLNKFVFTLFSKTGKSITELPDEFFEDIKDTREDSLDMRYTVFLPKDFPACVVSQLERYHYAVLKVIEQIVLQHNPENFFKVDGRVSASRMFNSIKQKLRITIPKAVSVMGLFKEPEETGGEGEPPRDIIQGLSAEEAFEVFCNKNKAGPIFRWTWSNWYTECPVAMKEDIRQEGLPQYAVQFMNRIFFLSNEEAFIKFCRNPRPYLLPPYPKLSCRIYVLGPKRSGKTAVSKCLAYLLDGKRISQSQMVKDYVDQVEKEYRESVTSAALTEGINMLNRMRAESYEKEETRRIQLFERWIKLVQELLRALILKTPFDTTDETVIQIRDLEEEAGEENRTFAEICDLLKHNNVTCYFDLPKCKAMLDEPEKVMEYLPPYLQPSPEPEPATVFDDFVVDFVDRVVRNSKLQDIEVKTEDLYGVYYDHLKLIEENSLNEGRNRGGWVIDSMPLDMTLFEMIDPRYLPDDVFVLQDEEPFDVLTEHSASADTFTEFRRLFVNMGEMEAALRTPSLKSADCFADSLMRDIIKDVLDRNMSGEGEIDQSLSPFEQRRQSIYNYYKNLAPVIDFLSSRNANIIKIDTKDKSMEDVLKEVIKITRDRYKFQPHVMTPEERAQEAADLGEALPQEDEIGAEEAEEITGDVEDFQRNRRYGDTSFYCPVTFLNYWILWKGKEEFAVKFANKLYLCATENDANIFLSNPYDYVLEDGPPQSIPPPRICVTGFSGCGKTILSQAIADNFCLHYIDFQKLLKEAFAETMEAYEDDDVLNDYLLENKPLPEDLLVNVIDRFWFSEPYRSDGFVIDNFPLRPPDIDAMEKHKWIPDIIIEPYSSEPVVVERRHTSMFQQWQQDMEIMQREADEMNRETMDIWEEKRREKFNELMEAKREQRYDRKMQEKSKSDSAARDISRTKSSKSGVEEPKSQISFMSVDEQADHDEINAILDREMPEPVFKDDFETAEQANGRFLSEIDRQYILDMENLRVMREYSDAEQIPWARIDGDLKLMQVKAQAFLAIKPIELRNRSIFERCYDISVELAEKLLASGYYFPSKFKRTCPVQYFDGTIPIQLFLPLEKKFQIYPMIHRQSIYFLAGKERANRFRDDPLKFTSQTCLNFPLIPFRVAIIGPPKCGKTTLAERYQYEFGFKVISRGQAIRYVLSHLRFSQLAKNMEEVLRRGWELTNEMVMKCVEAATYDWKANTQGFVMDGFPNCIDEVRHLADIGLVPHLILDVKSSLHECLTCSEHENFKSIFPKYSQRFINHRFVEWEKTAKEFRRWVFKEYQMLYEIPINPSKWSMWQSARNKCMKVFSDIKHYYKHTKDDRPLGLSNMQITPLEFLERKSQYKSYCSGCLRDKYKLTYGGDPPDRTNLVQYKAYYYWLCDEHINEFNTFPDGFIEPENMVQLPETLPERLFLTEMPEFPYELGDCVVCFRDNQPSRVLRKGKMEYAVLYDNEIYLFDTEICMNRFLREPHKYCEVMINFRDSTAYPSLDYGDLPTLGLLEQYASKVIIKAVTHVATRRPVTAGLSPEISAAVLMGLMLKLYNGKDDWIYEDAHEAFERRTYSINNYLKRMKSIINPFLYYEDSLPEFRFPEIKYRRDADLLENSEGSMHAPVAKTSSSVMGIIDELIDRVVID